MQGVVAIGRPIPSVMNMNARYSILSLGAAIGLALHLPAQVTQFGSACPAAGGVLPGISVRGAPFAGAPLVIDVTGPVGKVAYLMLGFSNQSYQGTPLPFPLAAFGNPGCEILVGPQLATSLPLDAQGRASLSIPGVLPAGARLYAQALMLFGPPGTLVDGVTEGIEITVMAPTTQPVIASLSTLSGGVDDEVVVRGANFGSGPATDICMAVADASDRIQAFLKVGARSDTEMRATIKAVRPGAVAGRLGFIRGAGQVTPLPPVPGATASQPSWNWNQPAVAPTNMAMSSQSFLPLQSFTDGGGACVPCQDGMVWFDQQGGQFTATLPDLCDGVIFCLLASEFWWFDNLGNYHRIEFQVEQIAICGMNAAARANYLAFLLSFNLSQYGLSAFAPNANTLNLQVAGGLAFAGGSLALYYKYDPNLRASQTDGICDDFALPTEPASPSASLVAWKNANYPVPPLAPFDHPNSNAFFLHTIPIPAGTGTTITGLSLQLTLRAIGGLANNDSLSLVLQGGSGGSFVWGVPITSLPGTGGTWANGQTVDVCLNLANLPASSGGVTSVLAQAIAAGSVDIYIQDDTKVDCATLTVQRCQ